RSALGLDSWAETDAIADMGPQGVAAFASNMHTEAKRLEDAAKTRPERLTARRMRQIAEDTLTDLQQMRRTAAQTEPETEQELDFEAGDIFG
ncbi:hypothetical protein, partial [Tritonibacter sp. SIMBA_163]|uniref:hypothetical protein n=1 Tax=Tritonibacter sp. SIMBA_163 TaxID=3080868 RepID=UPI00398128BE